MNLHSSLEESLGRYDLLQSKFYVAWSSGRLPVSALKTYAREYGSFISLIPRGWAAHGDHEVASEEVEHLDLWSSFAKSLGTSIGEPHDPGIKTLVETVEEFFSDPVTSLGALYAFEAQQPKTSKSKLEGLTAHYPGLVDREGETYFRVHAEDDHEPALLLERISRLAPADRERALTACDTTCRVLREALDSLYQSEMGDAPITCH